jgi:predicted transcriptional regulator of viral defense system
MKLSEHQTKIVQYLHGKGEQTKAEIMKNVSIHYYANSGKHFGDVLSRMVKNGTLERVSKGKYKIKTVNNVRQIVDPKQISLF